MISDHLEPVFKGPGDGRSSKSLKIPSDADEIFDSSESDELPPKYSKNSAPFGDPGRSVQIPGNSVSNPKSGSSSEDSRSFRGEPMSGIKIGDSLKRMMNFAGGTGFSSAMLANFDATGVVVLVVWVVSGYFWVPELNFRILSMIRSD